MRAVIYSDVETDVDSRGRLRRTAKKNAQVSLEGKLNLLKCQTLQLYQ
jgi:hypothetical protein